MDVPLAVSAASLAVASLALVVSVRRPRVDQRYDAARMAADGLSASIQQLRATVWAAGTAPADAGAVRQSVEDCDLAFRLYAPHLPVELRSLRRSVIFAATNYFGGPAGYAFDPRVVDLPLNAHEQRWWDLSVTYLDYVVTTLQTWRIAPGATVHRVIQFDQWRRETG